MQKAVQLQFINTVNSFLLDSFGRLVEDSLPLLANNTLRERLLRVNQDYRKFVTDQQAWNDLLGDSSRPIQWRSYNLSGMRFFSKWFNFLSFWCRSVRSNHFPKVIGLYAWKQHQKNTSGYKAFPRYKRPSSFWRNWIWYFYDVSKVKKGANNSKRVLITTAM